MVEDAWSPSRSTDPGSATWQPGTITQRQAEVSAFLDGQFEAPVVRAAAERTLALLALEPGQSVLDVGCGNGAFLPLLGHVVGPQGRVTGLDPAPAFIAEAQGRVDTEGMASWVTVVEGDAYQLPFDDDSFDAARCERVLMHLDDPTAALQEMGRVVRPGGRVVVTEPDWAGALIVDHPDPEAFAMLYDRFVQRFRQPRMGRSLYRRFHEAGLVEREVILIPAVFTDTAFLRQSGMDLAPHAKDLVTEGALGRERADAAIVYLDAASRDGVFFASGAYFIAAGRVPEI